MNSPDWPAARWRKSSHSTETGGDCVEVANIHWRKSSRSGDTGGECIEVASLAPAIAVRDSKDPDGPRLLLTAAAWRAFTSKIEVSVTARNLA